MAFEQEPPLGPRGAEELVKKAGLAHPGFPHDGDELPVACTGQRVRLAQRLHLRVAPHETRVRRRREGLEACPRGPGTGYALKAGQLTYDCRYSTMHGMPVTGGRGFRGLKPLWYNSVPP
jgi:hypothetical protein